MITVKEEFLTDAKTLKAIRLGGHEAVTLWLAMKGYAAEHLTDGFVSEDELETLPGAQSIPEKRRRKALRALVECGRVERNGKRGSGLVDEVAGGWQLHDYLDHAPSREEIELRREKDKQKKRKRRELAAQQLAQMRAENSGDNPGSSPGDATGDNAGDGDRDAHRGRPKDPRARARDPQPSPAQPSQIPKADGGDPSLSGQGGPVGPGVAAAAAPTNFDEALRVPLAERSQLVLRDPHLAQWLEPHRWPEVVTLAEEWGDARLGQYQRDSGVRAAVELFAAEYELEELRRAARAIRASPWAKRTQADGGRLGMSSMTPESVRRALDESKQGQSLSEAFRNA